MNDKDKSDLVDYVKTLTDAQGMSVVTVKDGWVFTFTKKMVADLLTAAGDNDYVNLFVKSSEKQQKN